MFKVNFFKKIFISFLLIAFVVICYYYLCNAKFKHVIDFYVYMLKFYIFLEKQYIQFLVRLHYTYFFTNFQKLLFFANFIYIFCVFFVFILLVLLTFNYNFIGYRYTIIVYMFFYSFLFLISLLILCINFCVNSNFLLLQNKIFSLKILNITNFDGFLLDNLSLIFASTTIIIGFFTNIFQYIYMELDLKKDRFFFFLNYFIFSMVFFVHSANYLLLLIFWELLGVTSFFLITHYEIKIFTIKSGVKAYFFNRLSDIFLLISVVFNFVETGNLNFLSSSISSQNSIAFYYSLFFLVLASFVKSAQIWFYYWLPDSMEAPIPASALIHSATLVSAGVYLILRENTALSSSIFLINFIFITGVLTCIVFVITAFNQDDIKKILAFSTIANCGFLYILITLTSTKLVLIFFVLHGFYKSASFLYIGYTILINKHSQDLRQFNAIYRYLPCISNLSLFPLFFLSGNYFVFLFNVKHIFFNNYSKNLVFFYLINFTLYVYSTFSILYNLKILKNIFFNKNITKKINYRELKLLKNKKFNLINASLWFYFLIMFFFSIFFHYLIFFTDAFINLSESLGLYKNIFFFNKIIFVISTLYLFFNTTFIYKYLVILIILIILC